MPREKWRFGTMLGNAALAHFSPREFDQMSVYEFAMITQAFRKAHGQNKKPAPTDEEFFKRIGAA